MSDREKEFLSQLREDQPMVSVFLTTGVRLVGQIDDFDEAGVFLKGRGITQLVYRHSIATIVPNAN